MKLECKEWRHNGFYYRIYKDSLIHYASPFVGQSPRAGEKQQMRAAVVDYLIQKCAASLKAEQGSAAPEKIRSARDGKVD